MKALFPSMIDISKIEKIIGKKSTEGIEFYEVKWQNKNKTTWEPVTEFGDNDLSKLMEIAEPKRAKSPKAKVEPEERIDEEGTIEKDVPLRVVSGKQHKNNPLDLICTVEWKKRDDGKKPADSEVKNSVLKEKYPSVLIEFYESKIRFANKKRKRNGGK